HDEKSWTEFVNIYRPYIYAIVRNLGALESEIEDHVQSVLVICWQKLPDFEYDPGKGRFRFWLSRISSFTVRNHIRKINNRRELQKNIEIPLEIPAEVEEMSVNEWKIFISTMAWDNIKGDLNENLRLIFEALIAGQKDADIALRFGIAEVSVRVDKSRVEKKLFKEIKRLKRELD
ncbi:MAG: sigma-70 family RNA polymerase sigma factor, partial [Lentisphaeraceae bacterium]|nr:sigma-70 family RNA polymerase sigma factor [Lentisphaeraceae bacterium]